MTLSHLSFKAWNRASERAFADAIAGRITADAYKLKSDKLWAAYQRRKSQRVIRAVLALEGINIAEGALL